MRDESPFAAAQRILEREFNIKPGVVQMMMLIDAIRDALPPPGNMTIAALRAILREMEPHNALEAWATRCSRELVHMISKHPKVREAAKLIDDERIWCSLEGTISGMLMRVTRGLDLESEELAHSHIEGRCEEALPRITTPPRLRTIPCDTCQATIEYLPEHVKVEHYTVGDYDGTAKSVKCPRPGCTGRGNLSLK